MGDLPCSSLHLRATSDAVATQYVERKPRPLSDAGSRGHGQPAPCFEAHPDGSKAPDSGAVANPHAERAFLTANAQLETGPPSVLLRGLADCQLSVDDAEIKLGTGEVRTISVADRSKLTIPGMLDVEITPGSSTDKLLRKVQDARRVLDNACKAAGVANPDEARKAFEERREALRHLEANGRVEKENLRDLTYERLERKVHGLQKDVPDYVAKRVPEPAICPDLDSAKKEWANVEAAQREANGEWETAREALDAARSIREGLNTKPQEACVQLDLLAKDLRRARDILRRPERLLPMIPSN